MSANFRFFLISDVTWQPRVDMGLFIDFEIIKDKIIVYWYCEYWAMWEKLEIGLLEKFLCQGKEFFITQIFYWMIKWIYLQYMSLIWFFLPGSMRPQGFDTFFRTSFHSKFVNVSTLKHKNKLCVSTKFIYDSNKYMGLYII